MVDARLRRVLNTLKKHRALLTLTKVPALKQPLRIHMLEGHKRREKRDEDPRKGIHKVQSCDASEALIPRCGGQAGYFTPVQNRNAPEIENVPGESPTAGMADKPVPSVYAEYTPLIDCPSDARLNVGCVEPYDPT